MKIFKYSALVLTGLLLTTSSQAANVYVGKAKAAAVCSQCHGIRTTSEGAPFPPLAGRDIEYLKKALRQYRNKTRISDIMNNIAGSLTDRDINNIATYYGRLKP